MLRKLLVVFVVFAVLLLVGAGLAGAALPAPAWRITSVSTPTSFSTSDITGTDQYLVTVTNVGDAPSDGSPITMTDTLPSGLAFDPTGGYFEAGVDFEDFRYTYSGGVEEGAYSCSEGPPVSCTDTGIAIRPGGSITMHVAVEVASGAPGSVVNRVGVSGGGAPSVSVSETARIGASLPSFGFQRFDGGFLGGEGSPVSQAGAHPYQAVFDFNLNTLPHRNRYGRTDPAGNPKQVTVNLPAGMVVNPRATATRCTEAQLESDAGSFAEQSTDGCPDSSAVGTILATIGIFGTANPVLSGLYNMVPPPGVPAELGFDAAGLGLYVHLFGGLRTGGDYGLSASANDILQYGSVVGVTATLWGDPSDPSHDNIRGRCSQGTFSQQRSLCPTPPVATPFLTLPSACSGVLTTTVGSSSWQEPVNFIQDSFVTHDAAENPVGVTGCEKLGFSPSLSVEPESQTGSSPTGLNVDLRMPLKETLESVSQELLAEANVKRVVETLPVGVTVSPSGANGLGVCTPEEIGLSSKEKPSCPDSSKIGTAEVITPLLSQPAVGSVYVAQQGNNPFGSLIALYLVVEADGALIKLPGEVSLDPTTGRVTASFDRIPQLPFSELKLHLFGGPRAALVTPSGCGSFTTESRLTPWSSETAAGSDSGFQITGGCGSQGFAPSFTAGMSDNRAGGFSAFSVTISRQDGEQALGGVSVTTPPGLLGVLKGVERCPEPQASQGACGAGSLIGHTTATAGVGPDPVTTSGQVFLTVGYKGAPFGLSIVVPAVAGPFNLGNVVVRAAVSVDPHTGQITILSDPLPSILQGVPLDIRTVNVTVDRPGFMFNPTSCEALAVTGTLTSTQGASSGVSSRFQAANCQGLPFKPVFSVSTQAKTSKQQGASLTVQGSFPAGEANVHSVAVVLPKQLPARLTTIQQACPQATFNVNPASCPVGSNIGTASASTPILASALTGPSYLVSHGGAAFPDVVVILQGEGVTVDLVGSIDIKKGITSSDFATIPDAPISSFALTLPEGPHSGLAAVLPAKAKGSMCGTSLAMPFTITGQNGAQVKQNVRIAVTGCPKATKKAKAKHARGAHGKKTRKKG
jgi:uncharacterized repeat protein (TIGR01451 family)